ncbi:hypothetical protein GE21DRAFT_9026 [Neurospora crassa]|uniref:Uncharacterized protein n=1 Tax=Neurospora crassa (strain ATCC 24698 / 74-OR23-1A / CBS 708.71 / DSM 1257 / FGSC 987) TaxID=367110 RepID=V5IN58_NEUCR|nr:hypothetical protein NCU05503 [Neurospora crassa OR74A]ESA42201.1 hypothetical protein NCU05503 [Neurospora crassa OR74A]KHE81646.1 hypothetical protein GE21DRAFT_9026 [Neurospora crassa]|eukprot:XP_011394948.1 hypothetical protein NCU05503 [Neurospora crassa OR74A]
MAQDLNLKPMTGARIRKVPSTPASCSGRISLAVTSKFLAAKHRPQSLVRSESHDRVFAHADWKIVVIHRQRRQSRGRLLRTSRVLSKRPTSEPATVALHHDFPSCLSGATTRRTVHLRVVVLAAPPFLWSTSASFQKEDSRDGSNECSSTGSLTNAGPSSDVQFWNSTQRLAEEYRTEGVAYS